MFFFPFNDNIEQYMNCVLPFAFVWLLLATGHNVAHMISAAINVGEIGNVDGLHQFTYDNRPSIYFSQNFKFYLLADIDLIVHN